MAFTDLHEGVLEIFAERAVAPLVAYGTPHAPGENPASRANLALGRFGGRGTRPSVAAANRLRAAVRAAVREGDLLTVAQLADASGASRAAIWKALSRGALRYAVAPRGRRGGLIAADEANRWLGERLGPKKMDANVEVG